jgi:hypothetical protein
MIGAKSSFHELRVILAPIIVYPTIRGAPRISSRKWVWIPPVYLYQHDTVYPPITCRHLTSSQAEELLIDRLQE